jgi:hypothetical protein
VRRGGGERGLGGGLREGRGWETAGAAADAGGGRGKRGVGRVLGGGWGLGVRW